MITGNNRIHENYEGGLKMRSQLSNLQLELLKLYSTNLNQDDIIQVKRILARYFAQKAIREADKIWDEKGLSDEFQPAIARA